MELKNKRILITGGTSGIGLEMVKKLAHSNQIIVISRKGTLPEAFSGGEFPVRLFHINLANKPEVESVMNIIQQEFSSIDVLINNAAMQCTPEFLSDDFSFDSIQTEIDVNFSSICHLTYLALPLLLEAEKASVLNVNSGLAIAPKRGSAIYCATKSALDSFSKSLDYQLAETTVDVQQAFLPLVETGMTEGRGSGKLKADYVAQQIIKGLETDKKINDIGKVKLLRLINTLVPPLARRIMKAG